LALGLFRRQRGLERESPYFLLQAEFVAAHDRAEDHGAAAELRRAQAALAGAAGAFLLPRLLGRALDVADLLGLVGTGAAFGELPIHHAGENVLAHWQAENFIGQLDFAGALVVETFNGKLHHAAPCAARSAAGNGRSFGAGRFDASLIST